MAPVKMAEVNRRSSRNVQKLMLIFSPVNYISISGEGFTSPDCEEGLCQTDTYIFEEDSETIYVHNGSVPNIRTSKLCTPTYPVLSTTDLLIHLETVDLDRLLKKTTTILIDFYMAMVDLGLGPGMIQLTIYGGLLKPGIRSTM